MKCPRCGKEDLRSSQEILAQVDWLYMACPRCAPDPGLDKSAPFRALRGNSPFGHGRCPSCGRRSLDLVMLDILDVLVDQGLRPAHESLRSVGTPLVEIGYPLAYPPRLGGKEMIVVGENLNQRAATEIVRRVPEVKGIIEGGGVPGVRDASSKGRSWKLLAGCDLRGDVVQSIFGDLLVYKSQSKIHIEFSRRNAPKVKILEECLLATRPKRLVDGLCGPGTLGLVSILAGVKHVVFNDIWLPAVENVMMNLWANKEELRIGEIQQLARPTDPVGNEPVLVGSAQGGCEVEVYHGDLAKLFSVVPEADLCLIDPFPGVATKELEGKCRCKKVAVI